MLRTGMLWLDADPKTSLEQKLMRAVNYFNEKYGYLPKQCCVSLSALEQSQTINHIIVQPLRTVLPNHFWLGEVDEGEGDTSCL